MMDCPQLLRASILSIGDELLLGEITDTNSQYLAQELRKLGIKVTRVQTISDELDLIVKTFKEALLDSDIVLATGGLGPTADDLTIEALAKAVGAPLELQE